MRGITRPCRHSLPQELHERWRGHLCGLCLTLRDEAGQAARLLTGYDVLLLSVLVEAQAGRSETITAGRCALRGMRTAEVLPASDPGTRLAAASALLAGAAAADDKVRDGDLPRWAGAPAGRWSTWMQDRAEPMAWESGLDPSTMAEAARRAGMAEARVGREACCLEDLLAPSGDAVAELFAHTAQVAGKPGNGTALYRAGASFGRLVHLLDAVEDYRSDARRGVFNPLAVTSTAPDEANRLARRFAEEVRAALAEVEMVDPELAEVLLGPVLDRAVARAFPDLDPREGRSRPSATVAVALAATATLGIFGGRRRRGYYGDPYYQPPGYGYGRRGPSCCDLLACDCCANMACADCCGGDDDCCVCCC